MVPATLELWGRRRLVRWAGARGHPVAGGGALKVESLGLGNPVRKRDLKMRVSLTRFRG